MGEIADFFFDRIPDLGYGPYGKNKTSKPVCKHCGKTGLNWQKVKGSQWRLHDGKEVHVCKTSTEGFDEV